MDTTMWEKLRKASYLSRPLDGLLIERLAAHLPAATPPAVRESFAFGCGLLCSSLNRGDTFLPIDPDRVVNSLAGWLGLSDDKGELLLQEPAKQGGPGSEVQVKTEDLAGWVRSQWQMFVGNLKADAYNGLVADPQEHNRPLVYDKAGDRLYFERYYEAVTGVNALLNGRIGDFPFALERDIGTCLESVVSRTPPAMRPDVRQSAALLLALKNKTLLISGGPGTGKTTVVLQILRLFVRALPWLTADMIRIVAPTGRAAARMQESISASMDAIRAGIAGMSEAEAGRDELLRTLTGSTVHRLLVYNPSTAGFGHGSENPLDAAVVIVDEVSMLDIELFSRLLDALPPKCVLILLGDRFQLPSVEAGAVLGDLADGFDRTTGASLSPETVDSTKRILEKTGRADAADLDAATLSRPHFLRDRAVILTRSHRSVTNIQKLANAITTNDAALDLLAAARSLPTRETWPAIIASNNNRRNFMWVNDGGSEQPVTSLLAGWLDCHFGAEYAGLVAKNQLDEMGGHGDDALRLLDRVEASRILCVLREGPRGAAGINRDICRLLCRAIDPRGSFDRFAGLPILITRNSPRIELYNGDTGVLLRSRDERYFGLFRRGGRPVMRPLDSLPAWEPAFATTVHKSQGSEYDRVLLILPARPVPISTREIIYTAVTRAKQFAGIVGSREVLEKSLERTISRNTGVAIGTVSKED